MVSSALQLISTQHTTALDERVRLVDDERAVGRERRRHGVAQAQVRPSVPSAARAERGGIPRR